MHWPWLALAVGCSDESAAPVARGGVVILAVTCRSIHLRSSWVTGAYSTMINGMTAAVSWTGRSWRVGARESQGVNLGFSASPMP